MSDEFVLAEQTHAFVRSQKWEVAVLPFGATEAHNFHMPYGTDVIEASLLAREGCRYAYERGAKVLCLPTIPYGVNTSQLEIPGAVTMSVTPTTLLKILADLVDALERQGIRKLVLVNAHGGNELKPLARELYHRHKVFIGVCDWFRLGSDLTKQIFEKSGDHADEMETSVGLAYFPELIQMDQAGPGAARTARFDAVNQGWVSIVRPWHALTADTGVGDPRAATAEKGRRFMEQLIERLGTFLHQLAAAKMDETFPFKAD
jgi:creatinine amidohydrolase